MPEVIINGPEGRLEGRYHPSKNENAPIALILHADPQFNGNMNAKICYYLYHSFVRRGFSVLRFNFRGVEKSEGVWDEGDGEAKDVTAAIDWLENQNLDCSLYLAGFSFGTFAGLQAARNDNRIQRMLAVAPAVNLWSFDFMKDEMRPLHIIQGTEDEIVPFELVQAWVKEHPQVTFHAIDGAGHFFPKHMDELMAICQQSW